MRNSLPEKIRISATDPDFADRHAAYKGFRESNPVARTILNGKESWMLTRYADVEKVLKDPSNLVQPRPGEIPEHVGTGPASDFYRFSLPNMDPPTHTRLRKLAAPAFAPRAIVTMRKWVEELIIAGIDRIAEADGEIDFVKEFASVVPAQIACRLLHAPFEDAATVLERMPALNPVLSQGDLTPGQLAEADEVAQFYFDYIGDLADRMRGKLGEDDPVGALLAAEEGGSQLSRTELVITLVGFFVASYHTTMVAMTNTVNALLSNRDQWNLLRADPGLAASAWEEGLRFDSPVHFIWRYAGADLAVHEHSIPQGSHLLLGLASANRDADRFAHPDVFDITRADNRHLAFTAGGHYCLGAPLSRLEGEILLRELPKRLPNLELRESNPERFPDLTFPVIGRLNISPRGT